MTNVFGRIIHLLQPQERKKAIMTSVAMFVNALLDFASIAVLLPVLYYLLEGWEQIRAALFFCALATVVMVIKSVVSIFISRYQNRFLLGLYKRMSMSLYSSYYHRGLLYIREQGTSRLGYEVNGVCYAFSLSLLAPIAKMCGDVLLMLLIVGSLLIYAPMTALILVLVFIPFVVFYLCVIRVKAKKYGKQEMLAKQAQSKVVLETFNGYAEMEVNDAFPKQLDEFREGMDQIVESSLKMTTISRLPMILSELAVIVGLTVLVIYGGEQAKMLVAVFAVAAFKMIPAMRSILSGWTQIQNAEYALNVLEEGLADDGKQKEEERKELPFEKSLELSHVSFSYPGAESLFDDCCLVIHKGEYVGFSGVSGVGKSTVFNLLLGFIRPQSGQILIDGEPLTERVRSAWLRHVGYVSQDVFLFQASLAENVALGFEKVDRERVWEVLRQVRLEEWAKTLPEGMDTGLGERGCKVSGGQRQRIGIARALYKQMDVLLLDEATSSLDNEAEKEINGTLCRLRQDCPGMTILSIAHRNSSLVYCDRIVEMNENGISGL